MAEAYTWTCVFDDATALAETEAGTFQRVIDRVAAGGARPLVVMIEPTPDGGAGFPPVVCRLPEDARPIFFRRRMFDYDTTTGQQTNHRTFTAIGWQATRDGQNVKQITWVCPDGSLLVGEGEP